MVVYATIVYLTIVYAMIVRVTIAYAIIIMLTNYAKELSNAFAKEFRMLKLC